LLGGAVGDVSVLRARRRRYLRAAWIGGALVVAAFATVTARVFVWPDLKPLPAHADAIIELGGARSLDRDRVTLELARQHRAPVVIQSTRRGDVHCLPPVSGVRIECFYVDPNTTRGEARHIGVEAARRHWDSVILVTTPDQTWRADLRVSRCFAGKVYNATANLRWYDWFRQIPYQWLSSIKALTYQRTC
jgi:uncharacterized SAM-binding protein YcdF (DUF218 family)